MITVWPGFATGSLNSDEVIGKKLVLTNADGSVAFNAKDGMHRDATIDSTNPAARVWLWDKVRDGYRADGFDYFWMDETEPDIEWHNMFCHLGPCAFVYNIYPLLHTSSLYGGLRSVSNERVLILARDAYIGAQRNGTTFWSSDVRPFLAGVARADPDRPERLRQRAAVLVFRHGRLAGTAARKPPGACPPRSR